MDNSPNSFVTSVASRIYLVVAFGLAAMLLMMMGILVVLTSSSANDCGVDCQMVTVEVTNWQVATDIHATATAVSVQSTATANAAP